MHILIDTTSCLTLLGQSLSKTAFAVTLLKLTKGVPWQQGILWFCIVTMNGYNLVKVRTPEKTASLALMCANHTTTCRCCSNGVKSAAIRSIGSRTDSTSASPKASRTILRKAGMVSAGPVLAKTCSNLLTAIQAYNILMDFVFAMYPWLIMWKLDMKKSEKLGLCIVMSLVCYKTSTICLNSTHRTYVNT